MLEIRFKVFLQIVVHSETKKLEKEKKKRNKKKKKTSRGKTMTAPPAR